MLMARM